MTSTSSLSAGSVRDRIEAKLGEPTATGCREWQNGDHNPAGYYSFMIDGRRVRIHRAVYELEHGPIPEGIEVLHTLRQSVVRGDHPSVRRHTGRQQRRSSSQGSQRSSAR